MEPMGGWPQQSKRRRASTLWWTAIAVQARTGVPARSASSSATDCGRSPSWRRYGCTSGWDGDPSGGVGAQKMRCKNKIIIKCNDKINNKHTKKARKAKIIQIRQRTKTVNKKQKKLVCLSPLPLNALLCICCFEISHWEATLCNFALKVDFACILRGPKNSPNFWVPRNQTPNLQPNLAPEAPSLTIDT